MSLKLLRNNLLTKCRQYYTVSSNNYIQKNLEMHQKLYKQLETKIKISGPMPVSEYMKEVLTNPYSGYYMHNDVFGNKGDFVTSPELGQLFGEMCAIWFINEWKKVGSPKPFQLVELGPGRGSLCFDMLRVFKHFNETKDLSIHLVELSPHLSDLQAKKLCISTENIKFDKETNLKYKKGLTVNNIPVNWYYKLEDVPREFSLVIAHEFFDALPIQKFQKTKDGWREILIDINESQKNKFKYVLCKNENISSKLLINPKETREHVEISRDTIKTIKHLSQRLEEDGGITLIADYGHNGDGTDTFRAFKNHKLHDPLLDPGSADLTADVDFNLIKSIAEYENRTICYGPVEQGQFLQKMGINVRVEQLLKNASEDETKTLKFALDMMTSSEKMGKRFKLLSIFPEVLKSHLSKFPVAGFT